MLFLEWSYGKCIVTIFAICFFYSCTKQNSLDLRRDYLVDNDSIIGWIAEAKNVTNPNNDRKESLKRAYLAISTLPADSIKSKYLSQLPWIYWTLNDSLMFRKTNRETLTLALELSDSILQAETHWDLSDFFSELAIQDSTFYHYAQAQKIYNELGDTFMVARMLYNMASVQADVKDYTGSEINAIRAIELLKPLEKNTQLFYCYNLLGSISLEINEYERALEYYQIALNYQSKDKEHSSFESTTQNNIGMVYQEQGSHKKAIPIFKSVLGSKNLNKSDPLLYSRTLSNLGFSKFKVKDTMGIQEIFNEAIKIQDSIHDINGIARTHYNLAEYFLYQKDTTLALTHAQKAKAYALESNNNKRLLETLRLFPHLDPKNTYAYAQEYIALDDSLQQEERKIRDKFARIRFETNEVLLNNQLLARQRQLWIGIAAGVFLLALAVFVIINQIRRNQKLQFQRKQQESNQEIFNLLLSQKGKLEEGKHLEQRRVSEELHDSILSQMLGIRLVLTALNNKTDEDAIAKRAELLKKLQELEEEIRTISHELNNASYQKIHNFMESVKELLENTKNSSKMNFEFNYDSEVDWDQLSSDIKINLYRIVQEILQNCVKHALAKNINFNFAAENDILQITISDDGKGFDASKAKRGIGMKNIVSRLKKINGTWDIDSKIGQGTKIYLEIPKYDFKIRPDSLTTKEAFQNV